MQSGCRSYLGNWRLPQVGLKNSNPGLLVRQGDVDELIQAARAQDGWVNDVWPIGGTNNEDVLLGGHAIHLCQDLVDDTVCSTTTIANIATSSLCDRVQLIEEEHTGGCLAGLQKANGNN